MIHTAPVDQVTRSHLPISAHEECIYRYGNIYTHTHTHTGVYIYLFGVSPSTRRSVLHLPRGAHQTPAEHEEITQAERRRACVHEDHSRLPCLDAPLDPSAMILRRVLLPVLIA